MEIDISVRDYRRYILLTQNAVYVLPASAQTLASKFVRFC